MWCGSGGEHQGWPPAPDTASRWQEFSGSSPKRRRAEDKDEGIGSPDIWEDEKAEDLRREMIELRQQLDKERSVRMMLEEQVRLGGPVRCRCGAGHTSGPHAGSRPGSPPTLGLSGRQVRSLEAHMYPEKLKVIAQQVQLQQQQEQVRLLHQEKLEREQQIRTQVSAPTLSRPTRGGQAGKYRGSGRFSNVLGTSHLLGLAGTGGSVPAKLSSSGNWERVGTQPPHCSGWGAALRGTSCFEEGGVAWTLPRQLPSGSVSRCRGLCMGKGRFWVGRDSAWC